MSDAHQIKTGPVKKELVRFEKKGHVGRIILNRPEKRNAMNLAVWEALDRAIAAAA